MFRRKIACAALVSAICAAAFAQDKYPSRPVILISPYAAGGATETFARVLIKEFGDALGQSIVIEQKPGASGTIGARFVASSAPDGYTLLANTSQHVMYAGMYQNLPFDPMQDFIPIGLLGASPIMFVVPENSPYQSFQDVLQAAKIKNITFAHGALGSLPHLTGERIALQAQVNMTHVPFSGNAPAVTNLLGGHVDAMVSTAPSVMSHIQAGKLRALAVSTKNRMPELPDVPTMAESGLPGFDVTGWYGVWAPKGTRPAIVNQLNQALLTASAQPEVRQRMRTASIVPSTLTADQFAAFTEQERQVWLGVMQSIGMQPEN